MGIEGWSIFALLTIALTVYRADAQCSDCLKKLDELSKSNPTYYCQQGAIRYSECLRDCTAGPQLDRAKEKAKEVDTFCSQQFDECPSVTETFINQTKCFDLYGGLEAVVKNVTSRFESKLPKDSDLCNPVGWGRYCQSKLQKCKINQNLDIYLVSQQPQIIIALAICGSETADDLAKAISTDDNCDDNLSDRIMNECNIGCKVAESKPQTICTWLDQQADCIERLSAGCRTMERQFALPRFDTYAIANKYLGCSVRYNGVLVQAPVSSYCDYSGLLNSCFMARTVEAALDFYRLFPLFNRNLPLMEYCQYAPDFKDIKEGCTNQYLSCQVPQAKLFGNNEEPKNDFGESMGPFPLNPWGLVNLLEWLGDKCQDVGGVTWSDMICPPVPATTTAKPERPKGTPPRGTPNGGIRTPTARPMQPVNNGAQNFRRDEDPQNSSSKSAGMTLSLLLVSILAVLANCRTVSQ